MKTACQAAGQSAKAVRPIFPVGPECASGLNRGVLFIALPRQSVPYQWLATEFPGGASRLAALLLVQILPVSSLVAPCDPGAAPGTYATIHWYGTLGYSP